MPTRLSRTFSEGANAYPYCTNTEGDHCTRDTYTQQSPTQTFDHRPSLEKYKGADPSTNTCRHRTRP